MMRLQTLALAAAPLAPSPLVRSADRPGGLPLAQVQRICGRSTR